MHHRATTPRHSGGSGRGDVALAVADIGEAEGVVPRRIQLSRRRGWRKPTGAVVVARPSTWGNPFVIDSGRSRAEAVEQFEHAVVHGDVASLRLTVAEIRRELAGRDLACWCPLDEPCHADVLLRLANEPSPPVRSPVYEPLDRVRSR